MIIHGMEVHPSEIIQINLSRKDILLKLNIKYLKLEPHLRRSWLGMFIILKNIDENTLKRVKSDYVSFLKTLPNPEDRIADFEWRSEENLPDWGKRKTLIESRKTHAEIQAELDEDFKTIELLESLKIKCADLKEMVRGKYLRKFRRVDESPQ